MRKWKDETKFDYYQEVGVRVWVAIPHFRKWLLFCSATLKWRCNVDSVDFFCSIFSCLFTLFLFMYIHVCWPKCQGPRERHRGKGGGLRQGCGYCQSLPLLCLLILRVWVAWDARESVSLLNSVQPVWGRVKVCVKRNVCLVCKSKGLIWSKGGWPLTSLALRGQTVLG